jgi:hypothetical protein
MRIQRLRHARLRAACLRIAVLIAPLCIAAGCGDDGAPSEEPPSIIALPSVPGAGAYDPDATPAQGGAVAAPILTAPSCDVATGPDGAPSGTRRTVTGTVVSSRIAGDARGTALLLELDGPANGAPFAIAISEDDLEAFPRSPEAMFAGSAVCVAGVVVDYAGTRAIFVTDPIEIALR